jgi:hypothetical protein
MNRGLGMARRPPHSLSVPCSPYYWEFNGDRQCADSEPVSGFAVGLGNGQLHTDLLSRRVPRRRIGLDPRASAGFSAFWTAET